MKCIAIDGRGGSGKTYLSNILSEKLGASVFHLDEFGNDYEPFIGIPELIKAVSRSKSNIVIFEGVGVFDERFDQFNPFRILVNTGADLRRKRAAARDVPRSDRSQEEWDKIYDIWRNAETAYFSADLAAKAALITDENGNLDIENLIKRIRNV